MYRAQNRRILSRVAIVALLSLELFLCGHVAGNGQQQVAASGKNKVMALYVESGKSKVMALYVEIVTPHQEEELEEFMTQFRQSLWRSWLARMPESAMLGDSGKVIIRFQIDKDRSQPAAAPSVEQGAGKKMKSLTNAALGAIREATKPPRFPDKFVGPSIEFRATFFYNQPADLVLKQP